MSQRGIRRPICFQPCRTHTGLRDHSLGSQLPWLVERWSQDLREQSAVWLRFHTNPLRSQDDFVHYCSASRVQWKRRAMVHRTSLQVSSTSASGHWAFSTCSSQAVGHMRAFSHTSANWTSDGDNNRSSIPNCVIVHKEQQVATGEYYWIENIKRYPPHLKLYANLLQIQTLNLITILSFAAALRVQHNYKKYQLYITS